MGGFPGCPVVNTLHMESNSRGMGFIPGQGIRIPHTRWCSQKVRSKQVLKKKIGETFAVQKRKKIMLGKLPEKVRGNRIQNKGRKINKMKEQVYTDKFVSSHGEQLRSCCMMAPIFSEK